jgi:hypothetical protein
LTPPADSFSFHLRHLFFAADISLSAAAAIAVYAAIIGFHDSPSLVTPLLFSMFADF